MVRSPSTKLLAAAAVVAFAAVTAIAGASNTTQTPGVHNGVITTCVEPATKGNKATSGDLNFLICLKGARKISWNIRGPRGRGPAGAAGRGPAARQVRRAPKGQQARQVRRAPKGQQVRQVARLVPQARLVPPARPVRLARPDRAPRRRSTALPLSM